MTNSIKNSAPQSPISSLCVVWSESNYIEDGASFETMGEFDACLREASFNSPKGGCYDKTKFEIHWSNGDTYTGRIDLKHPSEDEAFAGVAAHVAEFCQWVIDEPSFARHTSAMDRKRQQLNAKCILANLNLAIAVERERLAAQRAAEAQSGLDEVKAKIAAFNAAHPELAAS